MVEKYLVNTKRLPCTVNFTITTDGSTVPIYIVGFDVLNPNTLYFRSRFLISGEEVINLNCPQSPIMLKIIVWSEDNLPYELTSISTSPLDVPKSNDPDVIFIEKFSRMAGRLRVGTYSADNVPFNIEYKRNIYTDDGEVHPTPARIHTELPLIQVSKSKFDQNTIPERVIILLHEKAHNFDNTDQDNEKEADQNALNTYNMLGYPKIEAVNAFGDIMSDTDDNYQRMLNLVSM
jgi:hypothetical protein